MAAALSISGRLVEGQTLTMEKVGTFTSVRWQTWTGHDWVDIGTPNSLTYVIPSGAAGRSYRVVGEMAGGTYQGAPTGNVFVDSNRAGFTPVISGGAQSATVAEQASPSTPYAYLSFTDADKDNYANGSLTAMTSSSFLGADGMDQLSIRTGTGQGKFSYNAATREVSYGFTSGAPTVIGRLDDIYGGGSQDLKVIFNANATKAVVDALIDNVQWANNDDSPSDVRILTLRLTDGTGRSAQQARVMNITPVNDAPSLNDATLTAPENQTAVAGAITGTDPDAETGQPSGLSFSLVAGAGSADNALFTIHASTGVLAFVAPPNYEDPAHAAGYSVRVRATDAAGATAERVYAIAVTNVNEFHSVLPIHGNALEDGPAITLNANITDPDVGEVHTITLQTAETLGSITANGGTFTYSPNGAFEHLRAGETATDSFFYKVEDALGRWSSVRSTVTVTGVNDVAVIGGTSTGSAREDVNVVNGKVTASGQLTITDPDSGQAAFQAFTSAASIGGIGTFSVDASGAWTWEASNASLQSMGGNLEREDNIAVRSLDGSTYQTLGVTVRGSNDAPVAQALSATVQENGEVLLDHAFTDVDLHDLHSLAVDSSMASGVAEGAIGPRIRYTSDASHDYLAEGETANDQFTYTVTDLGGLSSTATVAVTIVGRNDVAIIQGATTASVVEDEAVTAGMLTTGGQLTVNDADAAQSAFTARTAVTGSAGLGQFSIGASGAWSYQVANGNSTVQSLASGQSLQESAVFTSVDGTASRTVTVNIFGTNDAPVITSSTGGSVVEAGHFDNGEIDPGAPFTGGKLLASDDGTGTLTWSGTAYGRYGRLEVASDGEWTYQLLNHWGNIDALVEGASTSEAFVVTVTDPSGAASQTQLQIEIAGTNDAPYASSTTDFVRTGSIEAGKVVLDSFGTSEFELGGRIIILSHDNTSNIVGPSIIALAPNGSLDPSFGEQGSLTASFYVNELDENADGFLVAGASRLPDGSTDSARVARYRSDGSVDADFGTDGAIVLGDRFDGLVSTADNGFFVVGAGELKSNSTWRHDLAVSRFDADGQLLTTFGNGGRLDLTDHPVIERGFLVSVDSQNRPLLIGTSAGLPIDHLSVNRFTSDGEIDASFASGGTLILEKPDCRVYVLNDDSLLASWTQQGRLYLQKFNAFGQLDSAFGANGVVDTGWETYYPSAIRDTAGNLFVAMSLNDEAGYDMVVTKFDAAGNLVTGFGDGGSTRLDFYRADSVSSIELDDAGNLLVFGTQSFPMNEWRAAVARLLPDGTLDPGFTHAPSRTVTGAAQALEDDGTLLSGWSGGGHGTYGTLTIQPDGTWSYELDPGVALPPDETYVEVFPVGVADAYGATGSTDVYVTVVGY